MFKKKEVWRAKDLELAGGVFNTGFKTVQECADFLARYLSEAEKDREEMKAEIDKLKYPKGRLFSSCKDFVFFGGIYYRQPLYVYGNKPYVLNDFITKPVTGFRKKGNCVEIRYWDEIRHSEYPPGSCTEKFQTSKTFLVGDKLIPMETPVDFGDTKYEEVEL